MARPPPPPPPLGWPAGTACAGTKSYKAASTLLCAFNHGHKECRKQPAGMVMPCRGQGKKG